MMVRMAAESRLPLVNAPIYVPPRDPLVDVLVPEGFSPSGLADLLTPEGLFKLNSWIASASTEWDSVIEARGRLPFQTPSLVLGQECMVELARGIIWDLRVSGVATPLFNAPRPRDPILNVGEFKSWVSNTGYPDAMIIEELEFGWRGYTDATPFVAILALPSRSFLRNFDAGMVSISDGLEKGWSSIFDNLPMFPIRLIPMGSVPKSRSSARRVTHDFSFPYHPIDVQFSNSGVRYLTPKRMFASSNANTTESLVDVHLPKDSDISRAGVCLKNNVHTGLVGLKFDEKAAYNQTLVHISECWKGCVFWGGRFVVFWVLGFGSTWAPSCYNRLACLKHAILTRSLADTICAT
jgi:hypothetical protein